MRRTFIMICLVLGCTDDANTVRTLQAHGFTDIQTTGYALGCSDSDTFATGFEATNAQGARVSGTVCCGVFLKGCTVRF